VLKKWLGLGSAVPVNTMQGAVPAQVEGEELTTANAAGVEQRPITWLLQTGSHGKIEHVCG
jgi:hypothetical protein